MNTNYDQRYQKVLSQLNAGRDINLYDPALRSLLRVQLSQDILKLDLIISNIKIELKSIEETIDSFCWDLPEKKREEIKSTRAGLNVMRNYGTYKGEWFSYGTIKVIFRYGLPSEKWLTLNDLIISYEKKSAELDVFYKHLGLLNRELKTLEQADK
jgi:hypothetical protein